MTAMSDHGSNHGSIHEEQYNPNRPHSIDLTLELERQLDNESLPPNSPRNARPQSLDTHVLASIVTQLRQRAVARGGQ